MREFLDYYSTRILTANIGNTSIRYHSKPGLPEWDTISPALMLLASSAYPNPNDHVWCLNSGPGALAVSIAKMIPHGYCSIIDFDFLAIACSKLTQAENNIHNMYINTELDFSGVIKDAPDLVLFKIFKGRNLNRRMLFQVWHALQPGGRLLISGANDQGIQSVLKDAAQLFQNITILAYKKGNRVAQFYKSNSLASALPEWTAQPGIAPGTWQAIQLELLGYPFALVSLPGVFSASELDSGTHLLTSSLHNLNGKTVLDAGCGYGVVGIFASLSGASRVDMVDNQLFAVASTQENIARIQLPNCQVFWSDLLSAVKGNSYDFILSNPPFHTGIDVDYMAARALITSALSALKFDGCLQIVANRFIPYDRLMTEVFGNVNVVAQNPAYRILLSRKEKV